MAKKNRQALNYEAIHKAITQHNRNCPYPPTILKMCHFDIERMGWEEGETICGLTLTVGNVASGRFEVSCDGNEPPELEIPETIDITDDEEIKV